MDMHPVQFHVEHITINVIILEQLGNQSQFGNEHNNLSTNLAYAHRTNN